MKKKFQWMWLIPVAFAISSCEDVIQVNVDPGPERLIVDAFVNNLNESQKIRITRSIPYFATPGTEPGVEGALVAIADTTGGNPRLFVFADSGDGNYIFKPNPSTGDTFIVGRRYALLVVEGGDTLVSFSTLNPTAAIDSLHIKYEDGSTIGFRKGNYVEMKARDLPGFGNTYWVKTYINDSFRSGIFDINLAYDMAQAPGNQDGGEFIWPIRYGLINDFQDPRPAGTRVRVEIHSISLETYYYINQIISENANGGLFATPPINIGTNIFHLSPGKKRALGGFFSLSDVSRAEVVLP